MKIKKTIGILLALVLLATPMAMTASALSQGYVSYIAIAPRVTHTGAVREYDYANYKVEVTSTYFYYSFEEGGELCLEHADHRNQQVAETQIEVYKKGIFGSTSNRVSAIIHHTELNQKQAAIIGNSGAGKRVFQFSAGPMGLHADPVTMTSYQ